MIVLSCIVSLTPARHDTLATTYDALLRLSLLFLISNFYHAFRISCHENTHTTITIEHEKKSVQTRREKKSCERNEWRNDRNKDVESEEKSASSSHISSSRR